MNRITKLIQLSAKADQLINFSFFSPTDEEKRGARYSAIGTLAGGGLAAGALYAAGRNAPGAEGVMGKMAAGAGRFGNYGSQVGGVAKDVAGTYNGLRAGAAEGLGPGRMAAGKNALKGIFGKLRGLRFSSRSALVQLNAKLDEVIEFNIRPLTDNLHTDGSALYVHEKDAPEEMRKHAHLRSGEYYKLVDQKGRPTFETRGLAKTMGATGGAMLGTGGGALAGGIANLITKGKAGKAVVAGTTIGGAIGGGILGYRRGASRTLAQDRK